MFLIKLRSREALAELTRGRVFLLTCHGCREIGFPEEASEVFRELPTEDRLTTDYLCNPERLRLRLRGYMDRISEADRVLVLACGVGVQTAASLLEDVPTVPVCDTAILPGFQGLTPTEHDCARCGQCFLNLTGGICPITACSKGLVNGPCGGARNGKCEVSPEMDCGWVRILEKLKSQSRPDPWKGGVLLRDYNRSAGEKAGGAL